MLNVVVSTLPFPDNDPPTWSPIGGFSQTNRSNTSLSYSWTNISSYLSDGIKTDFNQVGVVGYKLYVNGSPIDVGNVTSYTITGLTEATAYVVSLEGYDSSGNESTGGPSISTATTDTSPPTWPSGSVSASNITKNSIPYFINSSFFFIILNITIA